jgi:hypothetical protein
MENSMNKKQMKAVIKNQEIQIKDLNAKIASTKSNYDTWYRVANEERDKIAEMHTLFDGLGNCPREAGKYNTTLSLGARFACFLQTLIPDTVVKKDE